MVFVFPEEVSDENKPKLSKKELKKLKKKVSVKKYFVGRGILICVTVKMNLTLKLC